MKRFLTFCLALVLLAAVLIRLIPESGESTLQTPPATTQTVTPSITGTVPTTQPATTEPSQPPSTVPSEPEPFVPLFTPEAGSLLCRDYFVYDPDQGRFLTISCDPDGLLYPASMTKLFTAFVALELLAPDTEITAGDELDFVSPDSSVAYILKGHRLTAAMLVEGMLLPSGNDAAYVLAAAAGRVLGGEQLTAGEAVACFVAQMNRRAAELGMTATHFANPDGYHHPDHYTTCTDLLTIAQAALEDPQIRRCVTTPRLDVVYASGQINTWHNSNLLVDPESEYYCPEAIGLKTGNTAAAGYCLLSAFEKEGRTLILGVFGCQAYMDRFDDSIKLYEMALEALT